MALAHKMLRILYSMPTNNAPYQDRSVDYETLAVKRNARGVRQTLHPAA